MKRAIYLSLLLSLNVFAQSNSGERGGGDDLVINYGEAVYCKNIEDRFTLVRCRATTCSAKALCEMQGMEYSGVFN